MPSSSSAARCRVTGLQVLLGALAAQYRPHVPGARVAAGRPRLAGGRAVGGVGLVAVAVPVLGARGRGAVAVEAGPAVGVAADDVVHDGQRPLHVGVVGREDAEPGQLEEPGVDDRPLVGVGAAVAEVVGDCLVGVTVLGEPDEVAAGGVGPGRGDRPALDAALEVVGRGPVDPRSGVVAVDVGDPAGRDQAGDLGGDGRRRVAALLLPPLRAERRTVRHHEVRRLADVVGPQVAVVLQPGLVGHQDRVRRLVELVAPGVGRLLAVDEGVTWEPAVGQLLALEQEAHGGSWRLLRSPAAIRPVKDS